MPSALELTNWLDPKVYDSPDCITTAEWKRPAAADRRHREGRGGEGGGEECVC